MRKHTLNLFRIANLHELDFSYRLVSTDLRQQDGREELFNKQIRKVADTITSRIAAPCVVLKRDNNVFIAIPANKDFEEMKVDVTPYSVNVKCLSETYELKATDMAKPYCLSLIQRFLDFEIRRQLGSLRDLWKLNAGQFFYKKPFSTEDSTIEIFNGFSYKLVIDKGQLYVCLNLATKYADKRYITNYVNAKNADTMISRLRGRKALYQNGDNWYQIEIEGFGKPIKDHEFEYEGATHNVFDFITAKTRNHHFKTTSLLKPDDVSLLYSYPGRSMEAHNGAASLARILFNTKDQQVKALHRYSIKDPSRRFEGIVKNIATHFQNLYFNGKKVSVQARPEVEQVRSFPMPELLYRNNRTLKVGHYSSGGNTQMREFGHERKQYIIDNGILDEKPFDQQFLIVPDYLDKGLVEAFKKNAEYQLKKLAPQFIDFTVIRYKTQENQSAVFQVREIEKALQKHNATSGFALFILPDVGFDARQRITTFHDCLKSKFYPALKVQCASASKIKNFFRVFEETTNNAGTVHRVPEDLKPKFSSYLFNLVMEHLIVNRKWPFALAKNLHYDVYIGVDVHDRYAGFTFFFKNGAHQFFATTQVPKKNNNQRAEKLKEGLLFDVIYAKLKEFIPLYAATPNGIVIVRDGRSFGEEQKALTRVISTLAYDGLVDRSLVKYGVVDLHKQSAVPFRIAVQTDNFNKLDNPITGAYRLLGTKEGFIFNTGYPFQVKGTAKPLNLLLQSGNVDFLYIMEDMFCQSMLAYSAPDRSSSLPVSLKLIDTLLEPLTATADIPEENEEEMAETTID